MQYYGQLSHLCYTHLDALMFYEQATRGHATFMPLRGTEEELGAMRGLRGRVSSIPFTPEQAFAYTPIFLSWETTNVIEEELIRNLIIAVAVIFLITLLLVAHWLTALLVLLAVALTMVSRYE